VRLDVEGHPRGLGVWPRVWERAGVGVGGAAAVAGVNTGGDGVAHLAGPYVRAERRDGRPRQASTGSLGYPLRVGRSHEHTPGGLAMLAV
jgi:hypothetical protein